NAGDNLFGPGWRANLTIGRAVRLVMRNVCGSMPGTLDRGTLGHPGKLSYVIAENEAERPWTPLHVERGFRPHQSAVTILPAAVLRPALEHRGRRAPHPRRRHAGVGKPDGPAELRRRARRRAHAHDRRQRLGQGDDPRVPLRAHPELARASEAHAPDGGPRP